MSKPGEEGFSLIETAVVTALVALGVGGLLQAVITAEHARASLAAETRLQASAHNLITDLSAATAYESSAQAQSLSLSAGTPVQMPQPASSGTPIPVACTPSIAQGILTVVCRDANGYSATAQAYVGQRAPAPGSSVQYLPPASWMPR